MTSTQQSVLFLFQLFSAKLLNSLRNWDRERIALLVKWKLHSALRFSMFEERGILTLLPFENAVKLIFRTIVGNY